MCQLYDRRCLVPSWSLWQCAITWVHHIDHNLMKRLSPREYRDKKVLLGLHGLLRRDCAAHDRYGVGCLKYRITHSTYDA